MMLFDRMSLGRQKKKEAIKIKIIENFRQYRSECGVV